MKDIPGTPGTLTGLVLRIAQCVFAAGSVSSMVASGNFFSFTAFCYLFAAMILQLIWSFSLAKKESTSQPISSQPIRSWRLGDCNIVTSCSVFLWRHHCFILHRLGKFYRRMLEISTFCWFIFPLLVLYGYFFPHYALVTRFWVSSNLVCTVQHIIHLPKKRENVKKSG